MEERMKLEWDMSPIVEDMIMAETGRHRYFIGPYDDGSGYLMIVDIRREDRASIQRGTSHSELMEDAEQHAQNN
jgi:hypothetical protein